MKIKPLLYISKSKQTQLKPRDMTTQDIQAVCCKCGSGLKYPVTIGGKIYGSSCASKHLGINDIPEKFTGNYDELTATRKADAAIRQAEIDKFQAAMVVAKEAARKITAKYWGTQVRIGRAYYNARREENDWERGFIASIARQLGGYSVYLSDYLSCETLEEADAVYQEAVAGGYKYDENYLLHGNHYRDIKDLSLKQIALFERIESKYDL